jgi:hypothetical protein
MEEETCPLYAVRGNLVSQGIAAALTDFVELILGKASGSCQFFP